jgi:hypothetical protein
VKVLMSPAVVEEPSNNRSLKGFRSDVTGIPNFLQKVKSMKQ